MQDAAEVRARKRVCNRSVVAGLSLMAIAMLLSGLGIGSPLVTTVGAIAGFVLLAYGVHVGWLVFYERDPDGPAS